MKKLPFILTFCTFLLGVKGQECKDSVVQLLFLGNNYPNGATPYFLSKTIADKNNNIYFNWPQPIFTDVINELTFFKINNEGKLIEKKIFTNNEVYGGPSFINSRNELVYTGFDRLNQNEPNKCNQLKLLCLDSSGTIKWEKKYLNNTGFFFGSNSAIAGKNDEIILAADGSNNICSNTALQKDYFLYKFSRTGALLMSKRYEITNLNLIGNNSYYIQSNVQLTGTEILMAGGFTYNEINQDQLKDAFFLSKIDYTSGKLLLTKAFTFTNNTQNPYRFHLKHIHYDSKTRQIVIVARAMAYEPSFFLMLLDENFYVIKTKRLICGEPEAGSRSIHIEVIRNDNTIAICNL